MAPSACQTNAHEGHRYLPNRRTSKGEKDDEGKDDEGERLNTRPLNTRTPEHPNT